MRINLKCFSDLAERNDCDYRSATAIDLADGSTVKKVMDISGVTENDVKIVFVNGKISDMKQSLNDGDDVTLVPATGGM